MTLTGDFIEEDLGEDYPSAFGITFTPIVSGIALAIIGIVGAGYIFMNMVAPAREGYNNAEQQKQDKLTQLNQIKGKNYPEKIAEAKLKLEAEEAIKSRVIAMFTNQDDLETLLIDFSNFIGKNQGTLVRYNPDKEITVINDNTLGSNVQGKLKTQEVSVQFKGNFNQTQAILKDLERLQPLLIINNYESKVTQNPTATFRNNRIFPKEEAVLTTDLKINAILPLSQKEIEQVQKANSEKKK